MTNFKWKTPKPLIATANSILLFPVDQLPPVVRDMAKAIAVTTSTDFAMASTAMLSAVGYFLRECIVLQENPITLSRLCFTR